MRNTLTQININKEHWVKVETGTIVPHSSGAPGRVAGTKEGFCKLTK